MDKIFCYSGTGNSFASAKQIAASLEMEVVHITEELVLSKPNITGETCIIIFPVYAYGVAKLVKRFVKQSTFTVQHLVVLATQGSKHGGALAEAIRLLRRRKQKVAYSKGIKAVENFVHMFKLPEEERIKTICQKQHELTESIIQDIKGKKRNKRFRFRPESGFISFIFRRVTRMFARRYKILDTCNVCGICHRVCPPNAIEMVDERPKVITKKCDHCQACMQLCPQRAIKFGKVTPESRRYLHQDVKVSELLKRERQND